MKKISTNSDVSSWLRLWLLETLNVQSQPSVISLLKANKLTPYRGLIKRQLLLERHHSRIDTQKGENLVA